MDYGSIVFAIVGFSASFFFCVPNLKRWHRQQITAEKLRLIGEALEHAEERVQRFQERHDRILSQMCTYYLVNKELEEALAGARAAMNEAMEFAVHLRRLQMKTITSFPDKVDHGEESNIPIHFI
jgi:Werner syndrome ATP-dependent helicase